MPLTAAISPRALYDAVEDHDLVVVPDNPLADAINRRVTEPQFGTFAATPRRLATGRRDPAEDRLAFLELVDRTDHPWKAIAYAVGNVLQCWEHQGSLESILAYEAYVDDTTREVVDAMADLTTTSSQLAEHVIDDDRSVAVVGEDQLTPLERSILPAEYDRVDLFADEAFDHPPFHVFDSATAIVDALLDTVTAANADDVAVVLDGGSRYSTLVEAALAAEGIPYYGGPGFVDDPDHRAFLGLLRTAFRGSETTVAEVKPILTRLGVEVPVDHDDKRLAAVDVPEVEWLVEYCARLPDRTFGEVLDDFDDRTSASIDRFDEELAELGLADEPVTPDRVDDLAFYLDSYEVPVDRENEGVLLADAKSSGYVDRPAVFHLGLDEDWTHSAPQRPWVDTEAQFDRYIRQFQLLLQSGTDQYYLVQDTAGGQPVTPCLYFGELLDEDVERFSDLKSVRHTRPRTEERTGFETESVAAAAETLDTISQSSLNSYVNSPRDYLFGRVLDSPDKDYFREGNLFHDFAECYVEHPHLVDEDTIPELVEFMVSEADPFFHDDAEPLRRRTYRIGLETIVAYLDEHGPERHDFLTPASGWGENVFAAYFGVELDSPLAERWFENERLGAKGKIDLVRAIDHLVDYKSGAKKSARQVVKRAAIDPPADTPNFQAALYLSHVRSEHPDQRIRFTFFHFLETMEDVIAGDADLADALTTVEYRPETFGAFVASQPAYDALLDGYNDCVETFADLGFEAYREIVSDLSVPETTDKEELRASAFAREFTDAVVAGTADGVDAEKGADQAIRELNGIRKRSFFREDLDAFETFLAETIEAVNRQRTGEERFPIAGPAGEPNYRRVDHRDLLLEGERDG